MIPSKKTWECRLLYNEYRQLERYFQLAPASSVVFFFDERDIACRIERTDSDAEFNEAFAQLADLDVTEILRKVGHFALTAHRTTHIPINNMRFVVKNAPDDVHISRLFFPTIRVGPPV